LPKSIKSLFNLEELYFGGNPIEDLPKELTRLPKLQAIAFAPTPFSESLPDSVSTLDDLFGLLNGRE
ncbi:MAG: hypothetical protein QF805_31290, partial [Pirellulaceae bacterium]|nr:hypothetical protein [Pirellulaceae bacterium]